MQLAPLGAGKIKVPAPLCISRWPGYGVAHMHTQSRQGGSELQRTPPLGLRQKAFKFQPILFSCVVSTSKP